MATKRIKDLTNTAASVASDAYLAIDGTSNGTEKITRDNFRQDTADAFVAAPGTYNLAPLSGGAVEVAKGGTGSTTASGARTNLSVNSIDEDAQANALKTTAPALYFNGTSSNVVIAADSKLVPTDGTNDTAFSGSCWVKADDLTSCPLFGIYGTSAAARNYRFNIDGSDKLTLLLIDTGGHSAFAVSNTAVTAYEGEWVHFAFTYGGSDSGSFGSAANQIALYINGSAVAVTPTNDNGGTYDGMTDGTNPLWIGRFDNSYKKSSIRDVKIFNRELTASEIAELARGNDLGFSEEWAGANGGVYTSDFSAGVDGWTSSQGTVAGNVDGVGGQDDNLSFTVNSTTGSHFAKNSSVFSAGKRYRVSFDYYVPSTNSHVDGLEWWAGAGSVAEEIHAPTLDAWGSASAEVVPNNTLIYIYATDGGSRTVADAGGDDVLYIKNVTITEIGTLADFRAERYDTSTSKLYDISDNAFVGTGTSVTLTGREVPVYETGTWTPTLSGTTTTDFTYAAQDGYYTRIGDTVFVRGYIQVSDLGTSAGNIKVEGLPFTSSSSGANSSVLNTYVSNMASLVSGVIGLVGDGTTDVSLVDTASTGATSVGIGNLTASTSIRISGTYQIQ